MVFARKVWKLLVGIKDGLALLFLLLFFVALYGVMSARPNAGAVREGALLLRLNGSVVEEPSAIDPFAALVAQEAPAKEYRARDIVHALRTAAKDDRVKAVVLDLSRFTGGGMVHMQEIGEAMDAVRAARKPVLTWAFAYADDGVLLASHASEVWVDPMGGAFIMGPGGNNLYFGRLLENLKVTAHIFRVGTYKDFVEPFVRNEQSPEARTAREQLYGAIWQQWQDNVTRARPKANIRMATADPAGWLVAHGGDAAKAAQAAGLVDKVGSEVDFGRRVAQIAGKDSFDTAPGAFAHTPLNVWLAANEPEKPGRKVGVVTIAGEIVDGEAGPGTAGGDRIAEVLDEALDDDLAALVIRVDSPGGSVTASETIRTAIERHKAKGIPIAVSMANLAASGGYWVSTPGQRIFAEPSTITGSIGIFAVIPSFERALADWGVTGDGVRTTPLSGQPDIATGLTPEVSAMLQASIEGGYARFLGLVGKSRGWTPQRVDTVAQGRVWDGGTARQKGLVDEFGGLDAALAWAARQAKLKDGEWHAEYLGETTHPYDSLVAALAGEGDDGVTPEGGGDLAALIAGRQQAVVWRAVGSAERLLGARGAQAYCLECPVPVATAPHGTARLVGRLAKILGAS